MKGKLMIIGACLTTVCLAWAGASARPEESVVCPVSDNLRGHENTEWSVAYAYNLTDGNRTLPRVLLIGDSICNGYKDEVKRLLDGRMTVSYWVSSYCVTSPGFLRLLSFYLDETGYDVVHFNNGLHSLHTAEEDFEKGLRAALQLIRAKQPTAKIIWTTSTPLQDAEKTDKVRRLNAVAANVISEFKDVGVDDLFAAMDPLDRTRSWVDTFHFAEDVILRQGKIVADAVLRECEDGRSWMESARRDFAERRFGVFIHWGLYAMYGQGEWYLERGKLDEKIYSQAMGGFYPSKFDAKEWVRVVKGAGAKYITITSRHHDGFSLWPTKVDDGYNVGNTPFRRDILGELAEVCRESGIQLNLYYSLMDWHRKDYPTGREKNARSTIIRRKEDYASYKRFMMGQLTELLDTYHPGCIWFDGEWDHDPNDVNSVGLDVPYLDWGFDSLYDLIHSRHALVANNNHKVPRDKEDISLFERDLPGENETGLSPGQAVVEDRPLEQCDVIQTGIWGFVVGDGKNFRSPQEVCAMICRAAAKGSNLLMNIGPQADGRLPDRAVEVMAEVGKWMARNGESIYGTSAGGVGLQRDVVSTRKGNVLYLHFLNPQVNTFKLNGEIAEAKCLSRESGVSVERTVSGDAVVTIRRPKDYDFGIVVKVLMK